MTQIFYRDVENLVALEAIRCMFGATSQKKPPPGPASSAADARNVKLRIRAWLFLSTNVSHTIQCIILQSNLFYVCGNRQTLLSYGLRTGKSCCFMFMGTGKSCWVMVMRTGKSCCFMVMRTGKSCCFIFVGTGKSCYSMVMRTGKSCHFMFVVTDKSCCLMVMRTGNSQ